MANDTVYSQVTESTETQTTMTEYIENSETNQTMSSNSSSRCSAYVSSASEEMEVMLSLAWGIALLVTLSVCSIITVCMFFHTWVNIRRRVPYGNRRMFLVRLTGLFPMFSITSLAGFYVPKASLIANWGASLFLATTLYTFVLLIVDYYGDIEQMEKHIEGTMVSLAAVPLTCCCPCLPQVKFSMRNFHRFRRLVLQTAYIRPMCVFLGAVLWADGIYIPSLLTVNSAYLYLNVISLVSSLLAVYALSVIYNATSDKLEKFMIGAQFATIRCILIITNVQNFLIAILVHTNVIPCVGPFDSAARGEFFYNMLVVVEMFFLTIFFKIYYWRWMFKHKYGTALRASVDTFDKERDVGVDVEGIYEHSPMNITHDRLHDLQAEEGYSAKGSLSNVSKTGSFKSETVV